MFYFLDKYEKMALLRFILSGFLVSLVVAQDWCLNRCGTKCCKADEECKLNSICWKVTNSFCSDCWNPKACCGSTCCPSDSKCCGLSKCCARREVCCGIFKCCPPDYTCCGFSKCCPKGSTCNGLICKSDSNSHIDLDSSDSTHDPERNPSERNSHLDFDSSYTKNDPKLDISGREDSTDSMLHTFYAMIAIFLAAVLVGVCKRMWKKDQSFQRANNRSPNRGHGMRTAENNTTAHGVVINAGHGQASFDAVSRNTVTANQQPAGIQGPTDAHGIRAAENDTTVPAAVTRAGHVEEPPPYGNTESTNQQADVAPPSYYELFKQ